ncbi:hypothetical protein [Flavobacterium sp.]|uniref:hypothetical protein n=1 Tax=Flavobacterium sp. TaxID=239 RepID=UPI002C43335B|nr:hypothetical protein [Flavobacterium sp.]HSD08018.1 hypothetical protein [Flavobacterium sp.]
MADLKKNVSLNGKRKLIEISFQASYLLNQNKEMKKFFTIFYALLSQGLQAPNLKIITQLDNLFISERRPIDLPFVAM